jgi:hypothetical protein
MKTICMIGVFMVHIAGAATQKFTVSALDFKNNGGIPREFSGEGNDKQPIIVWNNVPTNTQSFALICQDPDAPGGTWIHWVVYNIPAGKRSSDYIHHGAEKMADGTMQGLNSWPTVGYKGPLPPEGHGPHHYHFIVYALDALLPLQPRATKDAVEKAMRGHILAQAQVVGIYERKKK